MAKLISVVDPDHDYREGKELEEAIMHYNCEKHIWKYGNIAKKGKDHPRVRECIKCKLFEYV